MLQDGVEQCDEGDFNDDTSACTSQCVAAVCGDGLVLEGVEECDEQSDDCTESCALCDEVEPIAAGPLFNGSQANEVCPTLCADNGGTWTNQWWTTEPNVMSVCQCADLCPA